MVAAAATKKTTPAKKAEHPTVRIHKLIERDVI